jgi:alpha-tubulin suppressor-like RCC1 family protein
MHRVVAALAALALLPACKGRFALPADARFVTQIALGEVSGCARMKDGSARCWGANESGELGDGTQTARSGSVQAGPLPGAMGVAVGGRHACSFGGAEGEEVFCWGTNAEGELGDGSSEARATPVRVMGVRARALALGAHHSCALNDAGEVACWGAKGAGQREGEPRGVVLRGATAIAAGGDATCAILRDRTLACWGRVPGRGPVPVSPIEGLADVTDVAVSETHICVVRAWGGIACWGAGEEGELGDGAFSDRSAPVDVVGLTVPAREVAVGRAHTCALLRDGTVHCWGANARGQLADGTTAHRASPARVNGVFEIEQLTAAGDATCARFPDGSARCWGGLALPKTVGTTLPVPTEVRW